MPCKEASRYFFLLGKGAKQSTELHVFKKVFIHCFLFISPHTTIHNRTLLFKIKEEDTICIGQMRNKCHQDLKAVSGKACENFSLALSLAKKKGYSMPISDFAKDLCQKCISMPCNGLIDYQFNALDRIDSEASQLSQSLLQIAKVAPSPEEALEGLIDTLKGFNSSSKISLNIYLNRY